MTLQLHNMLRSVGAGATETRADLRSSLSLQLEVCCGFISFQKYHQIGIHSIEEVVTEGRDQHWQDAFPSAERSRIP